ncbi:MAG: monofunctional biosynthetic peptidoglycan transglycosylase [Rhodobacteraceae bacterium]|nr:monofunctional biosynthetic peptidoglycan transglycosylase [Paracoccaceae bacterium]
MARNRTRPPRRKPRPPLGWRVLRGLLRLAVVTVSAGFLLLTLAAAAFSVLNPPTNLYKQSERARLGGITHRWVAIEEVPPHVLRALVAAEDANFCLHHGFDMTAIRAAMADGRGRGASTISQQVAKNVYLWPARTWSRKAIEAVATVLTETFWSKRRILEVYLNVAEFDEGIFGLGAAAPHYFGVEVGALSRVQGARLAAVLPSPRTRSAANPTPFLQARARSILSGADTIAADGRDRCFAG